MLLSLVLLIRAESNLFFLQMLPVLYDDASLAPAPLRVFAAEVLHLVVVHLGWYARELRALVQGVVAATLDFVHASLRRHLLRRLGVLVLARAPLVARLVAEPGRVGLSSLPEAGLTPLMAARAARQRGALRILQPLLALPNDLSLTDLLLLLGRLLNI